MSSHCRIHLSNSRNRQAPSPLSRTKRLFFAVPTGEMKSIHGNSEQMEPTRSLRGQFMAGSPILWNQTMSQLRVLAISLDNDMWIGFDTASRIDGSIDDAGQVRDREIMSLRTPGHSN